MQSDLPLSSALKQWTGRALWSWAAQCSFDRGSKAPISSSFCDWLFFCLILCLGVLLFIGFVFETESYSGPCWPESHCSRGWPGLNIGPPASASWMQWLRHDGFIGSVSHSLAIIRKRTISTRLKMHNFFPLEGNQCILCGLGARCSGFLHYLPNSEHFAFCVAEWPQFWG